MKKAIFTMGLPGAGKSTVLHTHYNDFMNNAVLIDPDEIKKEKADYNPKEPQVYHTWSKAEAKRRMYQAIVDEENLIIDGTGTNVENMIKWIRDLQVDGYLVELVYVRVSILTSIYRNAHRERVVPEYIIRQKAETISVAFDIISREADVVSIIDND